ncbi:LysR family transcriptional regulator [Paenibacillus aurantius]|uniref:LysR family transcriptional regulator n=1 Tax=Paenibacillus aurantius TaxID=2918900 RepID=A0AA96LBH1_9BACL|nr:LysR family transcriptional regulator [Paenibacillus aurantius]WNQ08867.1 LysR family transcriptional regulator [Paenibacillus aurantius]
MDIRDMNYVWEVARHGSFTKAAEALHVTQPTISKMIKRLEEELGVTLFLRTGKKAELTDAGKAVAAHAETMVSSFRSLKEELNDLTGFRKGSIRLGLPPMVGVSFFPEMMGRFGERYPGIAIRMVEDGSKKLENELRGGGLDVAVILLPTGDSALDGYVFVEESLQLVLSPLHPLADKESIRLAELAREPFILFREDFALNDRILAACREAGFEPRVAYESAQWDFISRMAAERLGVALLPTTICRQLDPGRIRVVPLNDPIIPWRLAMMWRKEGYLSFAAREWIRFSRERLQEIGT